MGGSVRRQFPRQMQVSLVDDEALRMAADGMSVQDIAEAQGVSVTTVDTRLRRGLDRLPRGNALLWRNLLDAEIAEVKAEAWKLVKKPPKVVSAGKVLDVDDAAAVNAALNTILKALERQSKLRGLDAPNRQVVQVVDDRIVLEAIAQMEAQLAGASDDGDIVDAEVVPELEAADGREPEGGGDGRPAAAGPVCGLAGEGRGGEDPAEVPLVL